MSEATDMTFKEVINVMVELGSIPELRDYYKRGRVELIARWLDGQHITLGNSYGAYDSWHGKYGVKSRIDKEGKVTYTLDGTTRTVKVSKYIDLTLKWGVEYLDTYWRTQYASNSSITQKIDPMITYLKDLIESNRDTFVTVWGHAKAILAAEDLTHEIVYGQAIYDTYEEWGWGYESCMTTNPDATGLYVDNPDHFALIRFTRNGEPYGRCLLVTDDDGDTYTSTVYSDNVNYINLRLDALSREHGWKDLDDFRSITGKPYLTLTCNRVSDGGVPYMDGGHNWFSIDNPVGRGTFELYYGHDRCDSYEGDMTRKYIYTYKHYGQNDEGENMAWGTPDEEYHDRPKGYWSEVYRFGEYVDVMTAHGWKTEYQSYIDSDDVHPDMFGYDGNNYYLKEDLETCPHCGEQTMELLTLVNGEQGCKDCTRPVYYYLPTQCSWNGHGRNAVGYRDMGYWYIDSEEAPPLVSVWALNRYGEKGKYDTLPDYVWSVSHDIDGKGGIELWMKDCIPQGVTVWGQGVFDLSLMTE